MTALFSSAAKYALRLLTLVMFVLPAGGKGVASAQAPVVQVNVGGSIADTEWSPDRTLVAVTGKGGTLIFDSNLREVARLPVSTGSGLKVSWSYDSLLLAVINSEDNHTVQIWERSAANDFSLSATLRPEHKYSNSVAWHPHAKQLAVLVEDQPEGFNGLLGAIEVWHKTGSAWTVEKILIPDQEYIFPTPSLVWSPDGRAIAGVGNGCRVQECFNGDDSFVFVMGVASGETLQKYDFIIPPYSLAWSSRNQLVIGEHQAHLVDVASHQLLTTWTDSDPNFAALQIDWNADGTKFAAGSGNLNGGISIVDADTLAVLRSFSNTGVIEALDWSPDDQYLVTGSEAGLVTLWDVGGLVDVSGTPTVTPLPTRALKAETATPTPSIVK
jgi:WD40 repeat protein